MRWSWKRLILVALAIAIIEMLALLTFPHATTDVADVVLAPWFEVCRAVLPDNIQTLGNTPLGLMCVFSGVITYALPAGVALESTLLFMTWARGVRKKKRGSK